MEKVIYNIKQGNLSAAEKEIEKVKKICSNLTIDDVTDSDIVLNTMVEYSNASNKDEAKMHVIHFINYYISSAIESLYRLALINYVEGKI